MNNKSKEKNIVVLDAMGGDFAPAEIIKGASEAAKLYDCKIILTGVKDKIEKSLMKIQEDPSVFEIVNCSQEVLMSDHPGEVIRQKKDSSIFVGTRITAEKQGSAFVSAGNTGAVMAASLVNIKRIKGVFRPAIAVIIPLSEKKIVLIDSGANADCKPQYLAQFAKMGKIFSETILQTQNPKIGLANVGSEEEKGNELAIQSHQLIKEIKDINFIGNVEGRDIFDGVCDVVVCDGFTGNILLKSIEGIANLFFGEIKGILKANFASKISAIFLKNSFMRMKRKFDYEEYGGSFLIGVNGIVAIAHGSSKAKAIKNAVKSAVWSQNYSIVAKITESINN
ncbi:MAG TPA: phosphate acyltransferase PlsX [Actinobacteria bacterium]|jgi:glycerol-3-phosphate acyltransferase PlsX|nr:phosphate acyltransferase PlsX [Actinomycetota bacterium]